MQRIEPAIKDNPRVVERPLRSLEFSSSRAGFGFRGVIIATVVGLVFAYAPYPALPASSLDGAIQELAISLEIRTYGTLIVVALILSVGRQAIDVLLLRSMIVAFVIGVFFAGMIVLAAVAASIPVTPRVPWVVVVLAGGLIASVTSGPLLAIVATLVNLLWYRSFRSLRPWLLTRRDAY
ncbi:MAG TPA: hypothetical protein VLR46_12295 [Candidatus Dormibacteraeota bacterium]|nr:hypothetical protein [Candidatus Dormibacteraeota bacterium]